MIRLAHGRLLTIAVAIHLEVGELVQRLVDYTDFLRSYEVDIYEIVALKALLLLSPGKFKIIVYLFIFVILLTLKKCYWFILIFSFFQQTTRSKITFLNLNC